MLHTFIEKDARDPQYHQENGIRLYTILAKEMVERHICNNLPIKEDFIFDC